MTMPDTTAPLRELTLRGVVLGAVITVAFTAANVYLGLKIGLTFATSIPAAVISMAVLRWFQGATIHENNIVQTIASAAGTLSAIIFVLPGLVMVGWWQGFDYLETAAVCAIGGVLGVMLSVPLRRALVTGSDLPYPEGVAAAEVLKVGAASEGGAAENARGLRVITWGALLSAGYALLAAMKLAAAEVSAALRLGAGATSVSASFSLALIGVGHLVGLSVGVAMLVGLALAWGVLVPWLTAAHGVGADVAATVNTVFRSEVRFIGAGTIGMAAVWTLVKIAAPIVRGIAQAMAAARRRARGEALPLVERDLPIAIVGGTVLLMLAPMAWLLVRFAAGGPVGGSVIALTLAYVLGMGVLVAAVCGYMAGLIGASNSPLSGVGILAVLVIALLLTAVFGPDVGAHSQALVAFALFATALVFAIATIANDNLQDLKTGQLVGATPARQQLALVLGVLFGAVVIPPVLNLLNVAFGFQGAPGARPESLAAPQAALISALAQGVLGGHIDWHLLGLGAALGAVIIAIDELLARSGSGKRLPPLAVGMGIYLPMSLTLLIPVGALVGRAYQRWAARQARPELAERMGVLAATGLIVGESLFGVLFAGIVGATGHDSPLAVVGSGFETPALAIGVCAFVGSVALLYRTARRAATAPG